jgi:hypothetical protein
VFDARGNLIAVLEGGMLLNGNLDFVDTINAIVYREGSLPAGSVGTATLFLDDTRIATNVRLFEGARALGTRASAEVRADVLGAGRTWLETAFVVNDWYVSGYDRCSTAAANASACSTSASWKRRSAPPSAPPSSSSAPSRC